MTKEVKSKLLQRMKGLMQTNYSNIKPYFDEESCLFKIPFSEYVKSKEMQEEAYRLISYLPYMSYKWVMFIKVDTSFVANLYLKQVHETSVIEAK